MADGNLVVEIRDRIAIVTLNRPEVRNAFDDALITRLTGTFHRIERDASIRAMVLAGAGTAFCAGADMNWMKRMARYSYKQNLADARGLATMLKTLDRLSKPAIARVHGPAYAGGVGLVAACDIAIGSRDAEFSLSEARFGLSPGTISPYVVRAMGERAARRYFLTAERFGADEAYRLGLLSELAAPGELDETIGKILHQLLAAGPAALAQIKDLIRMVSRGGPITHALAENTAKRIARIRVSPEGREGIASFLEKRKPAWVVDEMNAAAGAEKRGRKKR